MISKVMTCAFQTVILNFKHILTCGTPLSLESLSLSAACREMKNFELCSCLHEQFLSHMKKEDCLAALRHILKKVFQITLNNCSIFWEVLLWAATMFQYRLSKKKKWLTATYTRKESVMKLPLIVPTYYIEDFWTIHLERELWFPSPLLNWKLFFPQPKWLIWMRQIPSYKASYSGRWSFHISWKIWSCSIKYLNSH